MFNLKFSWGFSWNQFFGASKIARSWALYLESDLGVVLSDSPEGRLVWVSQIFQDSTARLVKQKKTVQTLGAKNHWRVERLRFLLNLNKKQQKRQKSLSFFLPNLESHGCAGGMPPADPKEMNNATGTYIFTENCPEAQAIPTFFGGGWRWMTRSRYSNQTRRPISKMPLKSKVGEFFYFTTI